MGTGLKTNEILGPRCKKHNGRYAFSLVELVMVVALLGILAAFALPSFQNHTTEAREVAAKDNLRLLRNAIKIYATKHDDLGPGYFHFISSGNPMYIVVERQLIDSDKQFSRMPKNPFNGKDLMKMVLNDEQFPAAPIETDLYGWIYKASSKTIKLNWSGTDLAGIPYFDY